MKILAANFYCTDHAGIRTDGPGYPRLDIETDQGHMLIGNEQKLMRYGYEMVTVGVAPAGVLASVEIGPDDDVISPPGGTMVIEDVTLDPTVVAITREFMRLVDAGKTAGEIPVPVDA